jgi:hypothetical protein
MAHRQSVLDGKAVSIHARHCCRAKYGSTRVNTVIPMFQSAPDIAVGRNSSRPSHRPATARFNPRPTLLSGEIARSNEMQAVRMFQSAPDIAVGRNGVFVVAGHEQLPTCVNSAPHRNTWDRRVAGSLCCGIPLARRNSLSRFFERNNFRHGSGSSLKMNSDAKRRSFVRPASSSQPEPPSSSRPIAASSLRPAASCLPASFHPCAQPSREWRPVQLRWLSLPPSAPSVPRIAYYLPSAWRAREQPEPVRRARYLRPPATPQAPAR